MFTFRQLYHFLLDAQPPDREPWRDLNRAVLLDWADRLLPILHGLAPLAPASARTRGTDEIFWDLCELYALSRVNDLLLLPFQPAAPDEAERERPVAPLTLADYLAFRERLGLQAENPSGFHPFTCEIVTAEPAADPDASAQLMAVQWPALFFGDLLISRAGVRVRAGAKQLDPAIASSSPLLFAHRRRARPTADLSMGWGHNSQWRTAFRRDYRDAATLYYNVDGRIDAWTPSPAADTSFMSRDHLSPRQRYSATVHRCRIVSTDPAYIDPIELVGETVTEPRLDAATAWRMPPPSDRDEDPERQTRWLWFTNPPLPENAPPLLGAITPGRFLRLLNRLSAERNVAQWVWDGRDLMTPEEVVITAMAGAADGWIYDSRLYRRCARRAV